MSVGFVCAAYNVITRHRVNTQSWVSCRASESVVRQLSRMSDAEVDAVVTLLKGGKKLTDEVFKKHPLVRELIKVVQYTGARVPGSPLSYAALRRNGFAGWNVWAELSVYLTNNFYEMASSLCIKLCGVTYTFDLNGFPFDQPGKRERWKLTVNDPIAVAQFYAASVRAFFEIMCGWPLGATQQENPNCIFGKLKGAAKKSENSGRLGLHLHAVLYHLPTQVAYLMRILKDGSLKQSFFDFMELVSAKALPGSYWCQDPPIEPRVPVAEGGDRAKYEIKRRDPADVRCADMMPTLELASDPEERALQMEALERFVAEAALEMQIHSHNHSCVHGGGCGNDNNCRFGKPEVLVSATYVDVEKAYVFLICRNGMFAPYCPIMLLAQPCNHLFTLSVDQARWLRRFNLVKIMRDQHGSTAELPVPLPVDVAAALSGLYTLGYTLKNDFLDRRPAATMDIVLMLQERRIKAEALLEAGPAAAGPSAAASAGGAAAGGGGATAAPHRPDPLGQDAFTRARRAIAKVQNAINGGITIAATLMALFLLGYSDGAFTYKTVPFDPRLFKLPRVEEDGEPTSYTFRRGAGGRLEFTTKRDHYVAREGKAALLILSPFFFFMWYSLVRWASPDDVPRGRAGRAMGGPTASLW